LISSSLIILQSYRSYRSLFIHIFAVPRAGWCKQCRYDMAHDGRIFLSHQTYSPCVCDTCLPKL